MTGDSEMSRLTIDVTDRQHQSLKALAALQGKTMKEYAIERLFPLESLDEQALTALKTLLDARIAEAHRGEVDRRNFTEIADTVLKSAPARG